MRGQIFEDILFYSDLGNSAISAAAFASLFHLPSLIIGEISKYLKAKIVSNVKGRTELAQRKFINMRLSFSKSSEVRSSTSTIVVMKKLFELSTSKPCLYYR